MPQIGRGTAEGVAPVVREKQEFPVRGLHSLEAASRQADHARDGWCDEWRVLGRPGNTGAHTEQDAQCQEGMALRNVVHGQHAVGFRRNAHVRKTPKKWPIAADAPSGLSRPPRSSASSPTAAHPRGYRRGGTDGDGCRNPPSVGDRREPPPTRVANTHRWLPGARGRDMGYPLGQGPVLGGQGLETGARRPPAEWDPSGVSRPRCVVPSAGEFGQSGARSRLGGWGGARRSARTLHRGFRSAERR